MKNKQKSEDLALFRFSIIAPLVNATTECNSISAFSKNASKNTFTFENTEYVFSYSTIKR